MHQPEPLEPSRHTAGSDGDFDDLPDVPDAPDEPPPGGDGPMGSDDDAVKQIRRRVSPFGWLVILTVLGVGGGTGYYMLNAAIQESRDEREKEEGRIELSRILQQNLPEAQTAEQVRAVYNRYHSENVRMSARRILAGLRDPQAVPMLIDGLAFEGVARAQAALGLAEIGLPAAESAKARLLAVLPLTDPQRDRVEVAWALVVLNEPSAWPTVREMLEAGAHGFVEKTAGLGEFKKGLETIANGGTYFGPGVAALLRTVVANNSPASGVDDPHAGIPAGGDEPSAVGAQDGVFDPAVAAR